MKIVILRPLLGLSLLLGAGCAQSTNDHATTAESAEKAPASAPSAASKPAAKAEPAVDTVMTPPPRADDAERKSKNGRLEAEVSGVPLIVQYGRPSVNGREVFGKLIAYGAVWRTGADEATTITFAKDATVAGKPVKAGTYALFTIPGEKTWTVILNSQAQQWGAYKYDEAKDVLRAEVSVESHEATEALTFADGDGAIYIQWDDIAVKIPVGAG